MHAGTTGDEPEEWRSVMPDVSASTLAELLENDDSALARAVRRVTDESPPGEAIAGFNSAL